MPRSILAAIALLLVPLAASAQTATRKSGFGGGFKPGSPVKPGFTDSLQQMKFNDKLPPIKPGTGGGVSGGFTRPGHHHRHPGYPFYGVWPGFGGWTPFYGYPVLIPVPVEIPVPVYVPVGPPDPTVELSGEATAVLVLQFPADAEVWVNGKKGPGDPQSEWTLTSPPIQAGTEYSFDVKARWKANGKTFGYEKSVAVAAGNRSRSLVISGTEIKE
jgi:uncharacterized protein (TIGR03000 family)